MPDALLDLVLGSRCAVCERPGAVLCAPCRRALPTDAVTCWPRPTPPGLARPMAVGPYDGALKLMVNAHKEQHRFALARPLGDLLAVSAMAHVRLSSGPSRGESRGVVLVPVPSRRPVVRGRGHDPLLRITLQAATRLRGHGLPAATARLLRSIRAPRDQAGLGAADRAANLHGSMAARGGELRAPLGGSQRPLVLVVDDVITTGATVREAQRALEDAGVGVDGVAVVAATARRTPGDIPVGHTRRRPGRGPGEQTSGSPAGG